MEQEKILALLDELDKFRREHQNDRLNPSDWCMRCMEAIVARAGGFESRNDWTERLKSDAGTQYSRGLNKKD